jgi:hypothetical protein
MKITKLQSQNINLKNFQRVLVFLQQILLQKTSNHNEIIYISLSSSYFMF